MTKHQETDVIERILVTPFQKLFKIQSFSGILLFAATAIALIWANSPVGETYQSFWQYKIGITSESFELTKSLKLWVNDGLMAIFFFLIGLEIKRELLIGELNTVKKAAFPVFGAIGGMLFPITFFIILNNNPETSHGWGIPVATDIAFTLAILSLVGKRVPIGLKVFLTAYAIIDDLGAVMIIAIFYSTGIKWALLIIALGIVAFLLALSSQRIYNKYIFGIGGIIVWLLFLKSGIHPTVAGVLMAFTIPIRQKIGVGKFTRIICDIMATFQVKEDKKGPVLTNHQIEQLDELEEWTGKVQSPLQHLEHKLHYWVSYLIMPVFALANAGVSFGGNTGLDPVLSTNIALALVLGNFFGVGIMAFLSIKLKIAELPANVNGFQMVGMSFLAGVGFTMAIFIANLAYPESMANLDSSIIGILIGSFISGIIGFTILKFATREKINAV
jgi:NhaA family Na+:H+ antiporter